MYVKRVAVNSALLCNKAKLDEQSVKRIREEWAKNPPPSLDLLGRRYNVSLSTIAAVVKGKTWKQVA